MRIPVVPPDFQEFLEEVIAADKRAAFVRLLTEIGPVDSKGRYLHWDQLRHKETPEGIKHDEWWAGVKMARLKLFSQLPLQDKGGLPFCYCAPNALQKSFHWLDRNTSGTISADQQVTDPHTRNTYLIKSLVEEAICSSQLEGASTTRNVAREMIRQDRKPRDKSEQMILNNFHAMQFIRDIKHDPLTPEMICELHKILTENTLDDPSKAGVYRGAGDDIKVVDESRHIVLHTPPNYKEIKGRMKSLCDFANQRDGEFIHPVVRAIAVHFMLAYDHPFVDGNGRTARALFYWMMASQDYWLMEFISISSIIKKAPVQYGKAFLYTETDANDLTYFIFHQVNTIVEAVKELHRYLQNKMRGVEEAENLLQANSRLKSKLNFRQLHLLKHALKHPRFIYKIVEHKNSHGITYETARKDLLQMSDKLGLLTKLKEGRSFIFISPSDLGDRLAGGGGK